MKAILLALGIAGIMGHTAREWSETPDMRSTMYRMEAEARVLKKRIEAREPLGSLNDSLPDICLTRPTDPDEITDEFRVMAAENNALRLSVYEAKHPKPVFNRYIVSCIKCHESHCPGPINRISKLKIG